MSTQNADESTEPLVGRLGVGAYASDAQRRHLV
jgi:hypothetical protein